MSVFLRFCQTQLGLSVLSQILAQNIMQHFFVEGHFFIGDRRIIIGKADKEHRQTVSLESCETIIAECACELSGPIRTEVIEDDGILRLNLGHGLSILLNYRGNHKFIGRTLIIGFLHGFYGTIRDMPLSIHQGAIGFLFPIPTIIPIHGIITSRQCGNLTHT